MTSLEKECSLSLKSKGAIIIVCRCHSTSAGLKHSPHNPTLRSLAAPTSEVGRAESVCCPGSAAKSRGGHESAQTCPCDKFCNKIDWALSQHLCAQSQRTAQHHSSPKLSSSCTFSWNVTVAGVHLYCSCHHSCHWCRPTEEEHWLASSTFSNWLKTSSNPVNSKYP